MYFYKNSSSTEFLSFSGSYFSTSKSCYYVENFSSEEISNYFTINWYSDGFSIISNRSTLKYGKALFDGYYGGIIAG